MERKYEITSSSVLFTIVFTYRNFGKDEDSVSIRADVDMNNEQVYFAEVLPQGVDAEELKLELLNFLRPPLVDDIQSSLNLEDTIESANKETMYGYK